MLIFFLVFMIVACSGQRDLPHDQGGNGRENGISEPGLKNYSAGFPELWRDPEMYDGNYLTIHGFLKISPGINPQLYASIDFACSEVARSAIDIQITPRAEYEKYPFDGVVYSVDVHGLFSYWPENPAVLGGIASSVYRDMKITPSIIPPSVSGYAGEYKDQLNDPSIIGIEGGRAISCP